MINRSEPFGQTTALIALSISLRVVCHSGESEKAPEDINRLVLASFVSRLPECGRVAGPEKRRRDTEVKNTEPGLTSSSATDLQNSQAVSGFRLPMPGRLAIQPDGFGDLLSCNRPDHELGVCRHCRPYTGGCITGALRHAGARDEVVYPQDS